MLKGCTCEDAALCLYISQKLKSAVRAGKRNYSCVLSHLLIRLDNE